MSSRARVIDGKAPFQSCACVRHVCSAHARTSWPSAGCLVSVRALLDWRRRAATVGHRPEHSNRCARVVTRAF